MRRQKGMSLLISLLMLAVLAMLGMVGIAAFVMQEKMAGNSRDRSLAFQAAESALADARKEINPPAAGWITPFTTPPGAGAFTQCADDGTCEATPAANRNGLFCMKTNGGCNGALDPVTIAANGYSTIWTNTAILDSFSAADDPPLCYDPTGATTPAVATGACSAPTAVPDFPSAMRTLLGLSSRKKPRYVIDFYTDPMRPNGYPLYRITAVGYGFNSNTQVILQSIVRSAVLKN